MRETRISKEIKFLKKYEETKNLLKYLMKCCLLIFVPIIFRLFIVKQDISILLDICISFWGGVVAAFFVALTDAKDKIKSENRRQGLVFPEGWEQHAVIMGFNKWVPELIKSIKDSNVAHILVQTMQDAEFVRKQIYSACGNEIMESVVQVVYGDRTSEADNMKLMLNTAKEVYVMGETDEQFSESRNLQCLRNINKLVNSAQNRQANGTNEPLTVYLEMNAVSSFSIVKQLTVPDEYFKQQGLVNLNFVPFNMYETWARRLWGYYGQKGPDPKYYSLDFEDLQPTSSHYVHLVIAGFNRMGIALLLEALRICHYPNYNEKKQTPKTRITIIDKQMNEMLPGFKAQYPYIDQIQDIEVEYIHARLENNDVRTKLERLAESAESGNADSPLVTIAICFQDSDTGVSSLMSLPQKCFWNEIITNPDGKPYPKDNSHVKIILRQERNDEFLHFIMKDDVYVPKYNNVRVFGMLSEISFLKDIWDDERPKWIKAYYDSVYSSEPNVRLKESVFSISDKVKERDYLRHRWWATTEDERYSNRYQVEMYEMYNRYEAYDTAPNYPILSRMEHLRWCAERYILGYHRENDKLKCAFDNYKIHYGLRPFDDLHEQDKHKDMDVITNRKRIEEKTNNNHEL
ncbi:MAG: hypothetical protein IJQ97_01945 [Paludibacteraceae bacterium]|nr:hypothetical protein [Paludibacteraceae bacterium]